MHRVLPVVWPTDWRITTTGGGLYLVEACEAAEWRLQGIFSRLGDALAFGEGLHSGPDRFAALAQAAPLLPACYRVPTDEGWHGRPYRAAIAESPFSLEPAEREVFEAPGWQRACAEAVRYIARREKVLLIGAQGAGKTLFLRELTRRLGERGMEAVLLRPGQTLASDARVDALLVDDADRLGDAGIGQVLGLDLPVVLACRPGFELRAPDAWQLRLEPLSVEDVARFAAIRLRAAGRLAGAVEPSAIVQLAHHSGGIARELTVLAAAATLLSDLERSPRLTSRHVDDAAAIMRGQVVARTDSESAASPERATTRVILRRRLRRGLPALAGVTGLALVVATSWTAQWVARQAARAELEASLGPSQVAGPVRVASRAPEPAAPSQPAPERAGVPEVVHALEPDVADGAVGGSFEDIVVARSGPHASVRPSALASAEPAEAPLGSFKGAVNNQTLQLTGKLSVDLYRDGETGSIRAKFHAWDGLLGTGNLHGTVSPDGHVVLSGQLLMGRNPFICSLTGVIQGDRFVGSAQFMRPWGGRVAYSSFSLLRT
ncbi:MAG: hypothetical protein JOZ05_20765 [Acetobacteraceae bacterium]|nr:hypothetical protein [Acetobacteraceae bacterium]